MNYLSKLGAKRAQFLFNSLFREFNTNFLVALPRFLVLDLGRLRTFQHVWVIRKPFTMLGVNFFPNHANYLQNIDDVIGAALHGQKSRELLVDMISNIREQNL